MGTIAIKEGQGPGVNGPGMERAGTTAPSAAASGSRSCSLPPEPCSSSGAETTGLSIRTWGWERLSPGGSVNSASISASTSAWPPPPRRANSAASICPAVSAAAMTGGSRPGRSVSVIIIGKPARERAEMGFHGGFGGHRNLSEREARGAARRSRSDRDNLWEAAYTSLRVLSSHSSPTRRCTRISSASRMSAPGIPRA